MVQCASSTVGRRRGYLPLRPLPFDFDGAVEVILEVCISSPM